MHKSIYGLKQAFKSWPIRFDQAIKLIDFDWSLDRPFVCKSYQDGVINSLVLYVDDIIIIDNDVEILSSIKFSLSKLVWYEVLG